MRLSAPAVLAVLLLACVPLRAADDAPTPAERFRAAAAALPAPRGDLGFRTDGVLRAGGAGIGTFRLSARPALRGGSIVWEVEDRAHLRVGEHVLDLETRARLDRSLGLLDGEAARTEDGRTVRVRFVREDGKIRLRRQEGEQAETVREIDRPGPALATLSALVLFSRLAPEGPAEYEAYGFDPFPPGERYVDRLGLSARGKAKWEDAEARLFVREDERRVLTIALAPGDAALRGLRMEEKSGLVVDYVPAADGRDPAREALFEPPADTPEKAALLLALAYGTGDAGLLDRMVDWESVHREFRRKNPDSKVGADDLRRELLARLEKQDAKRDRDEVIAFLRGVRPHLAVARPAADRATVTFPESYGRLTFSLLRGADGDWRLSALP